MYFFLKIIMVGCAHSAHPYFIIPNSPPKPATWCPTLTARPGIWRLSRKWSDPVEDVDSVKVRGAAFVQPHMHWEQSSDCMVPAEERGECVWRVGTRESFIDRFRNKRIAFIGDSVMRNMMTGILFFIGECGFVITEFGPDDPDTPNLCKNVWASFLAHADFEVTLPPHRGNITLSMIWCPHARDLLGRLAEFFQKRPEEGGWDVMALGLGFWDVKDFAWGGHGLEEFENLLPKVAASFESNIFPFNPEIKRRLIVLSQSFTEPYEGRDQNIPNHLLDRCRKAWLGALQPIGLRVFDAGEYYRQNLEKLAFYGGERYVTGDGFHPTFVVAMTIMREIASDWAATLDQELGDAGTAASVAANNMASSGHTAGLMPHPQPLAPFFGETGILLIIIIFATILTLTKFFARFEGA